MPRRDSDKNQQKQVKKASDANAADTDFGNDLAEGSKNNIRKK